MKKWQMVSTHTGRRSFASNMVRRRVPVHAIMAITGHTKEATFLKYVKLTKAELAEIVAQHFEEQEVERLTA